MTKEAIKEAVNAQPFRPFTLRMADGSSYPVPARDFISISPSERRSIAVWNERGGNSLLDVMLITAIEREESVES